MTEIIIVAASAVGFCGLLALFRKRILAFVQRLYYRLYEWLERVLGG